MPQKKSARGKIARRLGINVFGNPKYDKILKKKPNGPGKQAGKKNYGKASNYGEQLLEKQKIRYCYGLSEKQFRNTFFKAKNKSGVTGNNFLQLLESRLDNTIYRLGWAVSREQARQMVNHGYFKINQRRADIPSMILKPGDIVTLRNKENLKLMIRKTYERTNIVKSPWLSLDIDNLEGTFISKPQADSIQSVGDLQAVIEYYSR